MRSTGLSKRLVAGGGPLLWTYNHGVMRGILDARASKTAGENSRCRLAVIGNGQYRHGKPLHLERRNLSRRVAWGFRELNCILASRSDVGSRNCVERARYTTCPSNQMGSVGRQGILGAGTVVAKVGKFSGEFASGALC